MAGTKKNLLTFSRKFSLKWKCRASKSFCKYVHKSCSQYIYYKIEPLRIDIYPKSLSDDKVWMNVPFKHKYHISHKNYFLGQLSADCEVWKLLSQSESKLNFLAVRNRGYGHFSPFFFVLILTLKKPCGPFMNLQGGRGSNYLFPDKKREENKIITLRAGQGVWHKWNMESPKKFEKYLFFALIGKVWSGWFGRFIIVWPV